MEALRWTPSLATPHDTKLLAQSYPGRRSDDPIPTRFPGRGIRKDQSESVTQGGQPDGLRLGHGPTDWHYSESASVIRSLFKLCRAFQVSAGTRAVSELSHGTVKHETGRVGHYTAPFNRQAAGDRYVELTRRVAQWS